MSPRLRERTLLIDNTARNRGIPASWNLGLEKMIDDGVAWTVILSIAVRFGREGGEDFLRGVEANPEALIVEATRYGPDGAPNGAPYPNAPNFGWHLTAISRRCVEQVGLFDENFYPGYREDVDYGRRLERVVDSSSSTLWPKIVVDGFSESYNHNHKLAGVRVHPTRGWDYYCRKWGFAGDAAAYATHVQQPTFLTPFNEDVPLSFWPRPPDPRAADHEGWAINASGE